MFEGGIRVGVAKRKDLVSRPSATSYSVIWGKWLNLPEPRIFCEISGFDWMVLMTLPALDTWEM